MRIPRATALFIGLGLLTATIFGLGATAHAQSFRSGNAVSVSNNETVNSSVYASGQNIDVSGHVNGDVFCAGQDVTISGTINGDVICAAQNIRVTGTVNGNVRLAAQTASIEGRVTGNATALTQTVSVSGSGSVGKDFSGLSQMTTINGPVGRDVAVNSESLTVNAAIGRNISAMTGEDFKLGSNAKVAGTINYTAPRDLQRDNGARIAGTTSRSEPPKEHHDGLGGAAWLAGLYMFVALLLISMVLVLLMPGFFQRTSNKALKNPGRTVLTGLIISLLAPAVIIALMFTVIGIPLALLAVLIYLVALTLAGPATAYLLGRLILRNGTNAILIMLLGSVVLLLLYFIPILDFFVLLAVLWFGLGSLALGLPRLTHTGYQVRPTRDILKQPIDER